MIPSWIVGEIETLLAEAVPYRTIAARLGVSRNTVQRIANGSRPDYAHLKKVNGTGGASQHGAKPPRRCNSCGAMVTLPCLACAIRARMQYGPVRHQENSRLDTDYQSIALMLRPDDQERYERVCAARERRRR